jgi:hypothetical protein
VSWRDWWAPLRGWWTWARTGQPAPGYDSGDMLMSCLGCGCCVVVVVVVAGAVAWALW